MLVMDSFGFVISWGTAVPEPTKVFQSSGNKTAAVWVKFDTCNPACEYVIQEQRGQWD